MSEANAGFHIKPLETAVLFLLFNRPDTTARVFEAICQARPSRLYLACDGPRSHVEEDFELVERVRALVSGKLDWDCRVKTLFREKNLGCKNAVSSAITWFFEQEEEGIILEDDCLPSLSFFWFCEELLDRYRHDSRVAMVAGTNFFNFCSNNMESYFFSRLVQIWGWATWRRSWRLYDCDMVSWPNFVACDGFENLNLCDRFIKYLEPTYKAAAKNEVDTWDYQWSYTVISNSMYVAIPNDNLIQNIGFGKNATHTSNSNTPMANLVRYQMQFPIVHPLFILPSLNYDLMKLPRRSRNIKTYFRRGIERLFKRNSK